MALTNKPKKSLYQTGETVYVLNGLSISSGVIKKVITSVSNPLDNTTGEQVNLYYLEDFIKPFNEDEIFPSKNALLYRIKGDYLNKLPENGALQSVNFSGDTNLSYCDLSNCDLSYSYFSSSNLEGANLSDCILVGCSFQDAILKGSNLINSTIDGSIFNGADLTNATLPIDASTKSTFKIIVDLGNWDPETTIWIDGLPIGN